MSAVRNILSPVPSGNTMCCRFFFDFSIRAYSNIWGVIRTDFLVTSFCLSSSVPTWASKIPRARAIFLGLSEVILPYRLFRACAVEKVDSPVWIMGTGAPFHPSISRITVSGILIPPFTRIPEISGYAEEYLEARLVSTMLERSPGVTTRLSFLIWFRKFGASIAAII